MNERGLDEAKTTARSGAALRRFGPLALLLAAAAFVLLSGAHRHLTLETIVAQREVLRGAVETNLPRTALIFAGIYIAAVGLSVPGAVILTVAAGFLFGPWLGGALAVVSATLGATLVFLVARSAFGETLARRAGPALARILEGFKADAASYMLFLRLVPAFPFWLVNLAPALAGVPLVTFAWTTLVGVMPGTAAFAVAGAGLDSVIAAEQASREACRAAGGISCGTGLTLKSLVTRELLVALGLLGLVALLPLVLRRLASRRRM